MLSNVAEIIIYLNSYAITLPPIAVNAIINASIILSCLSKNFQACEPVKRHSFNAQFFGCFETIAS